MEKNDINSEEKMSRQHSDEGKEEEKNIFDQDEDVELPEQNVVMEMGMEDAQDLEENQNQLEEELEEVNLPPQADIFA